MCGVDIRGVRLMFYDTVHTSLTLGFNAYDDEYIAIGVYMFADRFQMHIRLCVYMYDRVVYNVQGQKWPNKVQSDNTNLLHPDVVDTCLRLRFSLYPLQK